jgi:hypothetical protein
MEADGEIKLENWDRNHGNKFDEELKAILLKVQAEKNVIAEKPEADVVEMASPEKAHIFGHKAHKKAHDVSATT